MKKLLFWGCLLGFFAFAYSPQAWAEDRYYLLTQARGLASQGKQAEALAKYSDYIATHPALTGRKTAAYKKNSQYYLRNLLIAFSGRNEIQRDLGRVEIIQQNLNQLRQIQQDNWFGSKNLYSLARIYEENGATADALDCLNIIISDQKRNPRKTNNKVFIRAAREIAEIHSALGQDQEVAEVISIFTNSLDHFDFDLKDRYQIGRLLVGNGEEEFGRKILHEIVNDMTLEILDSEENAVVRTIVKLLELYARDKEATTRFIATLDQFNGEYELNPRNQYSLGIACLNALQRMRGLNFLERVKENFPDTTYARKALFVLGRDAASSSIWDKAIHYYSEYIDRYPEPRFFSLKAYSRLIDCHWAKFKDPGLMNAEVHQLADIVNDIADFETQLNLARDLKEKGFDDLAEATFDLGMVDARNRLQNPLEDEERLRILWIIQKYGCPLEDFLLVEDSARETLELLAHPAKERLKESEKARFFKSQTYIWLAQAYQKTDRAEDAIKAYSDFLAEFQGNRDANYVRFSLAEIYEGKGDWPRAKGLYEKIDGGVWKERASRKLKEQGHSL